METRLKYLIILLALALILWTEMFVLKHYNFWLEMTIAASFLSGISVYLNHKAGPDINFRLYYWENKYLLIGLISAALLFLVFFTGDKISNLLFNFANNQVNGVYSNKTLLDPKIIGLLLLFIIGPSEEIFWRGYVQDILAHKFGENKGWIIASLIYGGVHIIALNFMLFMAALICGFFWGYVFKKYKSLWPGIISHALWDLTIFVLLPVR